MSDDIDIGQISEALNDKMDRDAGNPADLGKERIVGWSVPDYTTAQTINISSGTAIAPVTGVYEFHGSCNAGQYYTISINGVEIGRTAGTQTTGETSSFVFFANAGDTINSSTPPGANYVFLQCFEMKGLVNA